MALLALALFTSVIYERAKKYKHQQEINSFQVLHKQLIAEVEAESEQEKIKSILTKSIAKKDQFIQFYGFLDNELKEQFIIENKFFNAPIVQDILLYLTNDKYDGKIQYNKEDFYWHLEKIPNSTNNLLTITSLSPSNFSQFAHFFGIPFFISGFLLCWLMVWASIIVSSLVIKLENQKATLKAQAIDIEKARDDALQANSAKSHFLANMSHEIRTPLTSIIGYAESCLEGNQPIEERTTATKTIIKSGKHLLHIINEILDLSKIEAGKLEIEIMPCSLSDILEEVNQVLSNMANEKGLVFSIKYAFPLPEKIKSDPFRIKQILLNLCSNAIKFTQEGHVYLNVAYNVDTSKLVFEVADTGIGLSKEQQERIFKPFEQADISTTRKFGGTGLGLTLSKQLIKMLNGRLTVDSVKDKGSRFTATIKLENIENTNYIYESSFSNTSDKVQLLKKDNVALSGKVLVIEDNIDIQNLVKLIFKKVGITADFVDNGKKGLELALSSNYDLVFMDIQMPVMDGMEAMQELKKQHYKTPVIAMTANAMKQDREECANIGFTDFVSKPIDLNELNIILSRFLKPINKIKSTSTMLTSSLLHDEPDLIDLIGKFIKRLPDMREAINKAHSQNDEAELSGLIHQMKGVGGGYGYQVLTDLCIKIEDAIKSKQPESLNVLIKEFNDMADQILAGDEENQRIAEQAEIRLSE